MVWIVEGIKQMTAALDAYNDIADLYLSMVSEQDLEATDIDDPLMGEWIAKNAPDGAKILDAGCGLGLQTIALHRGLPARKIGKHFLAYGSDYSQAMLDAAVVYGKEAGLPSNRFYQSSFAELPSKAEGGRDFDVVMVNGAIYTFPDIVSIETYDAYVLECMKGFSGVLKSGGHLIFNIRDWSFLQGKRETDHHYENTHGGKTYHCHYAWTFNDNGHHVAAVTMSNSDGKARKTSINFAQRTPEEMIALGEKCGFAPVYTDLRATKTHYTIAMQKKG